MRYAIKSLEDVRAFERTPVEDRLRGDTEYDTLCDTVGRLGDQIAIRALNPVDPLADPLQDVTYVELLANVNRTANMLLSRGLKADEAVTHMLPLVPEGFYVKMAAEAVAIVNPVNPMLEVEHLVGITRAANTRILIAPGKAQSPEIYEKALEILNEDPGIQTLYLLGGGPECDGEKILPLEQSIAAQNGDAIKGLRHTSLDDVVAYFHTGGTTGVPKLAQHTQRMRVIHSVATAFTLGYTEDDIMLLGSPMFHVAGSVIMGVIPLICGVRLVLCSPAGFREKSVIQNIWQIVEKEKITCFFGVPTVLSAIATVPVADAELSALRAIWTGGAATPIELMKSVTEATGVRVTEGFGMTELGSITLFQQPEGPNGYGSVGIRVPYTEVKIGVEQPDGQVVGEAPPNQIGIMCFRGPAVMPGYVGGRAQAETFTDDGWLNTGDLARMDETGEVFITGRAKDMIIRGGHNIDPQIIEDVLHAHPAVLIGAAVGCPDAYAGELPVAYVQLKAGADASSESILEFVREKVTERAAAPVEVTILAEMPKTGFDKVFKPALRMDAIKRVFERTIQETCPQHSCNVVVENNTKTGLLACVHFDPSADPIAVETAKAALDAFTVNYEVAS